MALNRRKLLKIVGAGGAVALIGVAGGARYVTTRSPIRALEPWRKASFDFAEPRMDALSYAILAPNPHNRQPWVVAFKDPNRVAIYCDPERRLPETDPFDRQIAIGLGCFVEQFGMAAAANGYSTRIDAFPEGESQPSLGRRPVAPDLCVALQGQPRDPLFAHVLARRTNKKPYDTGRPVS